MLLVLQVVLFALGVDVSLEKRDSVDVALLVISVVGLLVGSTATWLAWQLALKQRFMSSLRWGERHPLASTCAALPRSC